MVIYEFGSTGKPMTILLTAGTITDVSQEGLPLVQIPATANSLIAGKQIYIKGTQNYNGLRTIYSVDTNSFIIKVPKFYGEEVLAGTETASVCVDYLKEYEFAGYEFHAEGTVVDAITVKRDTIATEKTVLSEETADDIVIGYEPLLQCKAKDRITWTWDNSTNLAWNLRILVRPLA